jgi:hypothetical protein
MTSAGTPEQAAAVWPLPWWFIMIHATPQFYVRLARGMLRDHPELARRYLALRRRRKVLSAAARAAHREAVYESPLADVRFRPPLSVAGCDSLIVVKAQALTVIGVPVAFERDAKGRHRGTPVSLALHRLTRALDRAVSVDELIALYQQYMRASPRLLGSHPIRKWAKLPWMIAHNREQLEAAEQQMLACLHAREREATCANAVTASVLWGTSRYIAFVDRRSLGEVLTALDSSEPFEAVVAGFRPGTGLRLNKRAVVTVWGRGEGTAVLRVKDLGSLVVRDDTIMGPVGIECLPETWRGWAAVRNLNSAAKTFHYFGDLDSR